MGDIQLQQQIVLDLSTKYGFDYDESIKYITNKYFTSPFDTLFDKYSRENIIEALKLHAKTGRKKHIFAHMHSWTNNEFIKYMTEKKISIELMSDLLVQSVVSLNNINNTKINHKNKCDATLIEFIKKIHIGDIIARYIVIEKDVNSAKCIELSNITYNRSQQVLNICLMVDFDDIDFNKNIINKSYKYLRQNDRIYRSDDKDNQSTYSLHFNTSVYNKLNIPKYFDGGKINNIDKRSTNSLREVIMNIKYPKPEDYPSDFNECPYFKNQNQNQIQDIDNVTKWCDILQLEHCNSRNAGKIKKAYKKLALQLHPDKNKHTNIDTTEQFQQLGNSYVGLLKLCETK
jgi:hypothetical protein